MWLLYEYIALLVYISFALAILNWNGASLPRQLLDVNNSMLPSRPFNDPTTPLELSGFQAEGL
jgi:hypothetical protein